MATGGYELVHQAMEAKVAAPIWEAESLARRQGHARVTPVHVASAILSSTPAARVLLLSAAAQQLRQEDLLLCFNAALSRLQVACPPPSGATSLSHMVAPRLPLSNALIAALKRAQMLQTGGRRRGRRQQLADVKIELEQLVVSILHDPGVYRAVKQAGSGSPVKPNIVEKGASLEQSDQARAARTVCQGENLDWPLAVNLSCHSSGDHASQRKTTEELPAFVGQSTATIRPLLWLRHHEAAISTCRSTSFQATCCQQKFAELSATNFKIMCDALERRVPWHKHIASGIASTVLWCRSGMLRRSRNLTSSTTWLLFQGRDSYCKKEIAQELSNLIFGTNSQVSLLDPSDRFSTSKHENKTKRSQEDGNTYVMRRLLEVVRENPHRVVFINDINQPDCESDVAMKNLIAMGRIMGGNGSDMVNLEDTILALSTEETSSPGTMASCILWNREYKKLKGVESRGFSLDLNASVEDVGEEEEENLVGDNVGITSLVDGVFCFE